jgi:hypothetical protein
MAIAAEGIHVPVHGVPVLRTLKHLISITKIHAVPRIVQYVVLKNFLLR